MSFIGDIIGGNKQNKAIDQASNIQQQYYNDLLTFQKEVYGDTGPFRDIALQRAQLLQNLFPDLLGKLNAPASDTVSPAFTLAGNEGLNLIRSNFATSGDPNSGPSQIAAGRFMEGLGSQEAQTNIGQQNFLTSGMLSLLGGGPSPTTGVGESANLLGMAGGSVNNLSNLAVQKGAVTAGMYAAPFKDAQDIGLLWGMGAFS